MIDIHSHILPGVDDGSKDMDMSVKMAKTYMENKIKKVIATPHYIEGIENNSLEDNKIILEALKNRLKEEEIDLEVFLGHEVMMSLDILKDLGENNIATLNGSRYILIELPMFDIPLYTEAMIYELLIKGYQPIIAHPERNRMIVENPNLLFKLIEEGALAQLNLGSIEGKFGRKIAETGQLLLKHNMIHFVATDAHRSNVRTPAVENSLKILKNIVSKEDFHALTFKNSKYLLENREIEKKSPIKYRYKVNFFNSFMKKVGAF